MKYKIIVALIAGLALAMFMTYAAYRHNPQGSIHTANNVDYIYLLTIGLSWFLVAFISVYLLVTLIALILKFINS